MSHSSPANDSKHGDRILQRQPRQMFLPFVLFFSLSGSREPCLWVARFPKPLCGFTSRRHNLLLASLTPPRPTSYGAAHCPDAVLLSPRVLKLSPLVVSAREGRRFLVFLFVSSACAAASPLGHKLWTLCGHSSGSGYGRRCRKINK